MRRECGVLLCSLLLSVCSSDLSSSREHGITATQILKTHPSLLSALKDVSIGHSELVHSLAEKSKANRKQQALKEEVEKKKKKKDDEAKNDEKKDEEDRVHSGVDLMSEEQQERTILRCMQSDQVIPPEQVKAPNVSVGIYVTNLGSKDGLTSGVYFAEFLFYLSQKGKPVDGGMKGVSFSNAKSIASIVDYGEGKYLVSGDFFFSPDLRYYPFDAQELKINVEQMIKPITEWDFVPSASNGISPAVRFPGWISSLQMAANSSLAPCHTADQVHVYPGGAHDDADSMNNVTFAKFSYTLRLQRPVVQGVLTHVFPPIVVFLPTLYSYWLAPVKDALTKMSLSGAGLVALTFIWQGIESGLPALDYLTAFDQYIVCFFVSISVALTFSIATYASFGLEFGDDNPLPRQLRDQLVALSHTACLLSVGLTFFLFLPAWVVFGHTALLMLPLLLLALLLGALACAWQFSVIRASVSPAETEALHSRKPQELSPS